uniref:Uncharacterized protein n=1 Tax=Glossina brevipalpis TaxID=37001 RepID=A0A1A9WZM5_9MUSC
MDSLTTTTRFPLQVLSIYDSLWLEYKVFERDLSKTEISRAPSKLLQMSYLGIVLLKSTKMHGVHMIIVAVCLSSHTLHVYLRTYTRMNAKEKKRKAFYESKLCFWLQEAHTELLII